MKCPHDYKQAVTSELDIYRAASILMRDYGAEQALLIAAKRADPLLDRGDADGQRMWKPVLRALQELIRRERRPGELGTHALDRNDAANSVGSPPSPGE